jgi:putative MATE family efflux protein
VSLLQNAPAGPAGGNSGQRQITRRQTITVQRHPMLTGPILPVMLRLAVPTILVLLAQTSVGLVEAYFVSFLGTEALAGVALVFPLFMLMLTVANGGVGGAVASAIAHALGAGRKAEAEALLLNALAMAVAFGSVFAAAELLGGRTLYWILGGDRGALAAAVTYGHIIFGGSILVWVVSLLAAAMRGSGNVAVPAAVTLGTVFVFLPLSPALIFGFGPFPPLGVAGAGLAVVICYLAAAVVLLGCLLSRRSALRLTFDRKRIEWRLLANMLRVGGLSALMPIQSNLTVLLVTGTAGLFGTAAIAGYGIASRLDYLMISLLFGLGSAVVTMVATNMGAEQPERARRIAWIGAFVAAAATEAIGLAAAVFPRGWLGLFTSAPDVLATGSLYLSIVAPFYGFLGLGLMVYYAGQGAGRVTWPVLAGLMRLVIAGLGSGLAVACSNGSLSYLFWLVATATIVYGSVSATWLYAGGVPAVSMKAECFWRPRGCARKGDGPDWRSPGDAA